MSTLPIDCRPYAAMTADEAAALDWTPAMRRLNADIHRSGVSVPDLSDAFELYCPTVYNGKVYAQDQGGWFVPDLTAEELTIALEMARRPALGKRPVGGW